MSTKSNFERLHEAGVLNADHFSEHDKAAIHNLSEEETTALINLRKKLGEAPAGKDHMRPNFPV